MKTIDRLEAGGGRTGAGNAIEKAAARLRCEPAVLQAVLEVESAGRPFDGKGRLIILTEMHVFWRELPARLRAIARALGLATPQWSRQNYGGLGRAGDDRRWRRLRAMVELHETAGLRSASYGGPQIMGFNHAAVGYPTVTAFVLAMAESEENQIAAFVAFLESVGLATALRAKDFRTVARRYNGSGQVSRYAGMMERAYARIAGRQPQVARARRLSLREGSEGPEVRALQERLAALGYPLNVDGDFGPATRNQVLAFQADNGLASDGIVGPKTKAALERATPRAERPDHGREDMTVADLRARGSQTVKHADRNSWLGIGTILFGGTLTAAENDGLLASIPAAGSAVKGALDAIKPITDAVTGNPGPLLVLIGIAAAVIGWQIRRRRLHDAKTWRHVA